MIKCVHDPTYHTLMYQAMGRLTFPEIRAEVLKFPKKDPTLYVLCDLTRGTVSDLTSQEIEGVLEIIGHQMKGRHGGKAAIVALARVDYELANIFSTYAEIANLPIQVKVFRTSEVAKQWLLGMDSI